MKKPKRPRIMREVQAAVEKALIGVTGVRTLLTGAEMAAIDGARIIIRVDVGPREQAALGRWHERLLRR